MNEVLDFLNQAELRYGAKLVREQCRKYMMKQTYAGQLPQKRKPVPRRWVEEAYMRQNGKCLRCGERMEPRDAVGDHIEPLAKGGSHNKRNIRALHRGCNASKGAADLVTESKRTGQTVMEQIGQSRPQG